MKDLREVASERELIDLLTDEIVTMVNKEFPTNQAARLRAYNILSDRFSGLFRALTNQIKIGVIHEEPAAQEATGN